MKFLPLLGRTLYSLIFIMSGIMHLLPSVIQYAAEDNVPMAFITVPLFGVIAFLGGLSILLGYKARLGAWLIVLFLIPVTYYMHDFWTQINPDIIAMQEAMFLKNISLLGAAFMIAYFGSGPFSLDAKSDQYGFGISPEKK